MNSEGYEKLVQDKNLKAGIHLFQGDNHIKTINATDLYGGDFIRGGSNDAAIKSVKELFGSTAWLYAAIVKRKSYMRQIPVKFYNDGEPTSDQSISGFTLDDLARIDMTIQIYGVAYYFKERSLGGTVDFQYINPAFLTPDSTTAYRGGFKRYSYGDPNVGTSTMLEDDLLIIKEWGTSEYKPMESATHASRKESAIMLGLADTMKSFYDTNGLPVVAVIVNEATQEEADAIKTRFAKVFSRFRSGAGGKTIGLVGDIKIEVISFAPKDLAMGDLSEKQTDAILATQEVPPALVYRTVNRAEAELKMIELLMTLDSRAKMITAKINADQDWQKANRDITIVTNLKAHSLFQKNNLEIATGLQLLTGTPVLTINEARSSLELEPIEGGDVLFGFEEDVAEEVVVEETKAAKTIVHEVVNEAWESELKTFFRWLKRRDNPDINDFQADHLSDSDKVDALDKINEQSTEMKQSESTIKLTNEEEEELFSLSQRDDAESRHAIDIEEALQAQLERLLPDNADIEDIEQLLEDEKDNDELYLVLLALLLETSAIGIDSAQAQITEQVDSGLVAGMANEESELQARESNEQINETTKEQILLAIAGGALTVAALKEGIAKLFGKERSELIAQNEGSNGFNIGTNALGEVAVTVEGFVWETLRDEQVCPICRPMHGEIRTKDESYFDPQGSPIFQPAHVKCRCGERLVEIEVN